MKFTNVKQLQDEFVSRSNGIGVACHEGVRLEDIERHADTLQAVMEHYDYSKLVGFNFNELMDMVSHLNTNTTSTYLKHLQTNAGSIQEAFGATTQAMSPTPIVNQGLVMYAYANSVLPYIAHMFDMKGSDRGLAYYINLVQENTVGDATATDLLASPKSIGKQTTHAVGTRVTGATAGTTVNAQTDYTFSLADAPVKPQSLEIYLANDTSKVLVDGTTGTTDGIAYLAGELGTATVDLNQGTVDLVLATAPAGGIAIKVSYNRDIETEDAATSNISKVTPKLEAIPVQAEYFTAQTINTLEQERLFSAIFGGNWNEVTDDLLGAIYNREIANKAVADLKGKVPAGSIFSHDLTSATQTGDNRLFNAKFVGYPINKLSSLITKASGIHISKASTLVANQDILPILRGDDKFQEIDGFGEDTMSGMALVGTYNKVPVIATPEGTILSTGEVLALHKSRKQSFLAPIVVGSFILPTVRNVFDPNNLSINKKQLIASNAVKTVAEKLAAKVTYTGIDSVLGS